MVKKYIIIAMFIISIDNIFSHYKSYPGTAIPIVYVFVQSLSPSL
jgi:hypothetical protein